MQGNDRCTKWLHRVGFLMIVVGFALMIIGALLTGFWAVISAVALIGVGIAFILGPEEIVKVIDSTRRD